MEETVGDYDQLHALKNILDGQCLHTTSLNQGARGLTTSRFVNQIRSSICQLRLCIVALIASKFESLLKPAKFVVRIGQMTLQLPNRKR